MLGVWLSRAVNLFSFTVATRREACEHLATCSSPAVVSSAATVKETRLVVMLVSKAKSGCDSRNPTPRLERIEYFRRLSAPIGKLLNLDEVSL